LFYRLNVLSIRLPALRERREDIPILSDHFLAKIATENNKEKKRITKDAMKYLLNYHWPGNIRELGNVIKNLVIYEEEAEIQAESVRDILDSRNSGGAQGKSDEVFWWREKTWKKIEAEFLFHVLNDNKWKKGLTAQKISMSRKTLHNKIKEYNLSPSN